MRLGTKRFEEVMSEAQWALDVPHGNRCSHCGKRLRYVAVLKHVSGEHITVGETCLGGRFSRTKEEFRRLRELGKERALEVENEAARMEPAAREAYLEEHDMKASGDRVERKAARREQFFADNPQMAAATYPEMFAGEEKMLALALSLNRQIDATATLTDRQVEYFESLYVRSLRSEERKERDRRAKEEAARVGLGAPRGKDIEVTGIVSSLKQYPNRYSSYGEPVHKMTVSLPGGARVFVTVPKTIVEDVQQGEKVRFGADFEAPKREDDPMFAYGKKPRRAEILPEDDDWMPGE